MNQELWDEGILDYRVFGDNGEMIRLNRNNYIADALKILSNEGIYICDHKVKNKIMVVILK